MHNYIRLIVCIMTLFVADAHAWLHKKKPKESSESSLSSLSSFSSISDLSSISSLSSLSTQNSSSSSSTLSSLDSSCTSESSLDSSEQEEKEIQEPQYDYFDETYIKSIVESKSRYFLVATGWSESSLGKMNKRNGQKQKRSFPMSYLLADRVVTMGGRAMIIYQTTAPINYDYRKYLYFLSHKDELAKIYQERIENPINQFQLEDFLNKNDTENYEKKLSSVYEEIIDTKIHVFERNSFRINHLSRRGRKKSDKDPYRYLDRGNNAYRRIKVPKLVNYWQRNPYESTTFVGFTAHFSGPHLEGRARASNLPYLVNPSSQAYRIKKSQSRQSFRDAGVRHPRGSYDPAFTLEDLTRDIYTLLMEIDTPKLVLKLDESAGGYGNKVMRFNDFDKNMDKEAALAMIRYRFNDAEVFPPKFIERIEEENGGAIVEEFIVGENFTSPASVYMITGKHKVSVRYTYDQLLGGTDNQDFKGSLGPIPLLDDPSSNIEAMSIKVGNLLSEQGVRGNVGTDFVIITNQEGQRVAYAIENNVRNTGTSYPYNALKMLVGENALNPKFMKAFDDVKIPEITLKPFREKIQEHFYKYLRSHPLTFDKEKVHGCLVHHDTFAVGKLGVVCVGNSLDEAQNLFEEFTLDINNYIATLPETQAYGKFYPLYISKINADDHDDEHSLSHSSSYQSLPRSQSTISFDMDEESGVIEEISMINGVEERRVTFVQ